MKTDAHAALDTLFLPFENGALACPEGARLVFLNAHLHADLHHFQNAGLTVGQYFKPESEKLEKAGFASTPETLSVPGNCDMVLALLPKSRTETLGMLGAAVQGLKKGGILCVAAGNKSGGNRIARHLKSLGIEEVQQETKNRARVVWAVVERYDKDIVQQALDAARPQKICDGAYASHPGIYGWDKVDKGSALLARFLPEKTVKSGADFGCGYGYLSLEALKKTDAGTWHCIDADWRAVEACKANMEAYGHGQVRYHWSDLTASMAPVSGLDLIVMNPPFHEGQKGNPEVGNAFIRNAASALNKRGELWMVANNHLPYERMLEELFSSVEKCTEEQGFKVYHAVK